MLFVELAKAFNEIEKTSSRLSMARQLGDLLAQASPQEAKVMSYLALGSLNPPYKGTQFGLAEKSMISIIATYLAISENAVKEQLHLAGDLGAALGTFSWSHTQEHTILEIYECLMTLEAMSGTGSHDLRSAYLMNLFKELDPLSAKYIVRIILGKLHLGFSAMTIIDALSLMVVGDKSIRDMIEDAYDRCADIGLITLLAKQGGMAALRTVEVVVGIPIRPAAAERLPDIAAIIKKIQPAVAQPKLDGFRLQIHVKKTDGVAQVHFFSRNLLDMTPMFPELAQLFGQLNIESLICDSEAIAYDEDSGRFVPFQETVKRKRKHNIEASAQELPLQVFAFDLLYLNGQEVMEQPADERRALLKTVFDEGTPAFKEVVRLIEEVEIHSEKELEHYFLSAIEQGLEGVIVKKPGVAYQPGKRNFNWIKLKRLEVGSLDDTLDVVILGYYRGRGKRASFGIGAFLVGVRNEQNNTLETIAKVGTGMSDIEWVEVRMQCDALVVADKPALVNCDPGLYPDVWVTPKIVCMVKADEITQSPVHTAASDEHQLGLALRFPRFMGYRPDKSIDEVTTVTEVRRLYDLQYAKKHAK